MLLQAPASPSCAPMKGVSLLPLFSEDLAAPKPKKTFPAEATHGAEGPRWDLGVGRAERSS